MAKNFYKEYPEGMKGNATKTPSYQTLRMEKQELNEIFNFALRSGYIIKPIYISYKEANLPKIWEISFIFTKSFVNLHLSLEKFPKFLEEL